MKDDWLFLRCKLIKILDQNSFPVHTLELSNPKVLIRPHQAESTKGKMWWLVRKGMRKRCCRARLLELQQINARGQDKEKGADSESTGLIGSKGGLTGTASKSGNSSKSKTRPSFKELLAKYEKEGTA